MKQEFSSLLLTGIILIIIYYSYKNSKYYTPNSVGPTILYASAPLYLLSYWIITNSSEYCGNSIIYGVIILFVIMMIYFNKNKNKEIKEEKNDDAKNVKKTAEEIKN